jgi:predicted RNA methylase
MPPAESRSRPSPGAWVLRCAPGLARLLQDELRFARLIGKGERPVVLRQRNHDLLFLPRLARALRPDDLGIAEEVHRCPVYGRYKISAAQLDRLAADLGRCRVVVSADGSHFDRRDLGRFLGRELAQRRVRLAADAPELWVFAIDAAYYFCRRVRDDRRRDRLAERPGSLPPTIAAAMAFLGHPSDGDVVLDPVCGSGSLLAEAHRLAPAARLLGFDIDPAAIAVAKRNLVQTDVVLTCGDGRRTGLAPGSVSLLLANLPFGKQFGERSENAALYAALIEEMRRIGRPGWRAVLLSSDEGALRAALAGLAVEREFRVQVRGERALMLLSRPPPS